VTTARRVSFGVDDPRREPGGRRELLDLDLAPPGLDRLAVGGDLEHERVSVGFDAMDACTGQARGDGRDRGGGVLELRGQTGFEAHRGIPPHGLCLFASVSVLEQQRSMSRSYPMEAVARTCPCPLVSRAN
jgi:hypothetical protein